MNLPRFEQLSHESALARVDGDDGQVGVEVGRPAAMCGTGRCRWIHSSGTPGQKVFFFQSEKAGYTIW